MLELTMSTRHLVDPELHELIDILDPTAPPEFFVEILPVLRASVDSMTPEVATVDGSQPFAASVIREQAPFPVRVVNRYAPGSNGAPPVRVLCYEPATRTARRPALLYMHGGGYITGAPELNDDQNFKWAEQLGIAVYAVAYRLAPETPAPGSVQDCYDVLRWMNENADTLGLDPTRVAVGGESAGGGLASALALLARDRGELAIAFQLLMYPMLDDRTVVNDPPAYQGEFLWKRNHNRFGWTSLLGCQPGSAIVPPYAAAGRAEDLRHLPSAFIAVGAMDLFCFEGLDYARRLIEAEVPTELHVYPRAIHAFDAWLGARVTQALVATRTAALQRALCESV